LRGRDKQKRKKNEGGDGAESREGCTAGSKGVDQKNKKDGDSEQPASSRAPEGCDAIGKVARSKEQHHGEE
jgi:hypothetical protein